ncbi:hypothetical protein GOP47_0030772, partial [Adiantum capillus-veneris]
YHSMIKKAKEEGIVVEHCSLFQRYSTLKGIKDIVKLPYFAGDFISQTIDVLLYEKVYKRADQLMDA